MALDLGTLVQYVDLDPSAFDRRYRDLQNDLDRLRREGPDVQVTAETTAALQNLAQVEQAAQSMPDAQVDVDADTSAAEAALEGLADGAEDALGEAGEESGQAMGDGILGALTALPIAGTLVALGAVAGKALLDGLENEVREDTLVARTGLDPATAKRIATAAGEAYGSNFGESIAANMETARLALEQGLLDPAATSRDAQSIIQDLQGVADVMQTDVVSAAEAVGLMLKTGVAKSSQEAFDLLVRGYQSGLDAHGDFIDTIGGSAGTLSQFGLTGATALGLIKQSLDAGAPSADFFVGALEELAGNAGDSVEVFESLGLSGEDMGRRLVSGGEDAKLALGELLQAMRDVEDPTARSLALVALFGEEATAFSDALLTLDTTTAVTALDNVAGAASGAISAIGTNAAGSLASAQRNIEVAADGIKGALASAFGPQIEDFSTFVQENRGAVVQFLLDLANSALDFGRAMVEAGASGIETFGEISGAIGDVSLQLFDMFNALNQFGPFKGQLDGAVEGLGRAALAAGDIEAAADTSAEALRTNLIENAIDPAQERLNEFGIPLVAQAEWHDATVALGADINSIGYAADGSKLAVTNLGGSFDTTTASGAALDEQLQAAVAGLQAQTEAGILAGRTQGELTADYETNRQALVAQVESMGFTRAEAEELVNAYGAIPTVKNTRITVDTADAEASVRRIQTAINNIRSRNVNVNVSQAGAAAREDEAKVRRGADGARASGGPVWPGGSFLVGEQGREIFEPTVPGVIHDAQTSAAMMTPTPAATPVLSRGDMAVLAELIGEAVAKRPTNLDGQRLSTATSRGMTFGVPR